MHRDYWYLTKSQILNTHIYALEQPNPEELLSKTGTGTRHPEHPEVCAGTCLPLDLDKILKEE